MIVGRRDLGKPDWRANLPNHPLSPQDISDLVAWLAAQRVNTRTSGSEPVDVRLFSIIKPADAP